MITKCFSANKWRLHEKGGYSFNDGPGFDVCVERYCTENKNPDCLRQYHRLIIQTNLGYYTIDLYCLVHQNEETKFYHRISDQLFVETNQVECKEKPGLEMLIRKRVNNGQLWVTSKWESCAVGYDDTVIEDSEKKYKSYKPYEIRLNRVVTPVEYREQPDEDLGVLFLYEEYEVKILIHSEFDPDIERAGLYFNEENEEEIEEYIQRCRRSEYVSILILNKRTNHKKCLRSYSSGLASRWRTFAKLNEGFKRAQQAMITVFSKWVKKYLDDKQFKVVEIIQSALSPDDFVFVYNDDPMIRKALKEFRHQIDFPFCSSPHDLAENIR